MRTIPDGPRYTIIADPGSLRWQFYRRDLLRFWRERQREPEVELIPWRDVLDRDGHLDGCTALRQPSLLRLESPARDVRLMMGLARAGPRTAEPGLPWEDEPTDLRGWMVSPGRVYRGLCGILERLSASAERNPFLNLVADLKDVAILFDKNATSERLSAAGIPTPTALQPQGSPEELLAELRQRNWRKAYVKLAYGSCASGIAVVEPFAKPPTAVTTVVAIDGRFHNTQRLQNLAGADLEKVLAFLIREGATVQPAIPMSRIGGQNFDVRVVVIYGVVAGTIFRASGNPMTNLHLGGRRADPVACRRAIPQRQWLDAMDHCVEAAGLFHIPAIGVDLVFHRSRQQHYVLELNAFGDFFPHWSDEQGRTIYTREIAATARRFAHLWRA